LLAVERGEFLARVRAAFEFFEKAVSEGRIAVYGTATWNGYRAPQTDRGWLSLDELIAVAREIAGDRHHFRAIQLPYNLAMPEAVTMANQGSPQEKTTPAGAAISNAMAVCASASLLQGRLARGLPPILADAFPDLSSDAQRAVQFVRSTPGVDVALVGMRSVAHVEEILAGARHPPASREALLKLFRPAK
jgi:predicted aldo/keto reductase-like oxidoreductase